MEPTRKDAPKAPAQVQLSGTWWPMKYSSKTSPKGCTCRHLQMTSSFWSGTKQEVKSLANKALQTFKTWTDKRKLKISLDKTNYLHINKNKSGPIWYSGIKWGQNNIKRASVIKYLGVLIDDKLKFVANLPETKNKSLILHQGLKNVV
ncbi:hypothetical protein AVEN_107290-1 [Araneus ventricosus]|uniref:Reverse transcriptase domain-containing protein n=1 Tax=Araneus ventricosus TaxID=182803 RepID=A0A4Y2DRY5_ARAVE|nr:hypothetical protein AVEN_107290-1 [Araneus ventricosus]